MRRPRPLAVPSPRIGLFLTPEQSELVAFALQRALSSSKVMLDRERLGMLEQVAAQLAEAAKEAKGAGNARA